MLDGKLYAAGGEIEADGAPSNLVERYDLATNAWEAVAPMAEARLSAAAAVLEGKLYAVGGADHVLSVERYDPALDAWESVASMSTARDFHGVAVTASCTLWAATRHTL